MIGRIGRLKGAVALLLATCLASPSLVAAQAPYDWEVSNARVTSVEVTYMPTVVLFATDASAGSCPAGTYLRWSGHGADAAMKQSNVRSTLATLMASKLSGTPIRIFGVNANCEVRFLYFG